ncbi:hypothetical protein ABZS29_17665 [Kribbella sp. NPDC005582]|uniref:hypothetical protein n=1 Tax=Kribbella sp. NPDC005582 TaxID=3156893 RepID=UPI0033AD1C9C
MRKPAGFEDLRDDLLTVANLAAYYAEHSSRFQPSSRAGLDAAESQYAFTYISRPGLELTLMAGRCLALAGEMARGVAHLLAAEGTLYSPIALIRPVMVSASRCICLTDGTVDTRERVRRWANFSIESAVEQANLYPEGSEARASAVARIERFREMETSIGHPFAKRSKPYAGLAQGYGFGVAESEIKMVKRLIEQEIQPGGVDVNQMMYRLASSLIHGLEYGPIMHIARETAVETVSDPSVLSAQAGMTLPNAAIWFTSVLLAVQEATASLLTHQGRSTHKLAQEIQPILVGWRAIYPRTGSA